MTRRSSCFVLRQRAIFWVDEICNANRQKGAHMLDTTTFENAAEEIIDQGWTYLDCPAHCDPQLVVDGIPAFFERRKLDDRVWLGNRPGEDEADVGHKVSTSDDKNHSGRPKDAKQHLMFSEDMAEILFTQHGTEVFRDPEDEKLLHATDELHRSGLEMCRGLLEALDTLLKPKVSLATAFDYAHCQYAPTATSATRLMEYFINGGQSHFDRDAITAHWKDKGGDLFAICPKTEKEMVVSPPEGKVLFFPSTKLQIATEGGLPAIRHGSYCKKGKARLAVVTFCQLITTPLVRDQEEAIKAGLEKYRLIS